MPGGPSTVVRRTVRVLNVEGLHARPCSAIARAAARFESQVRIVGPGLEADGRSIMDLMAFAAGAGAFLELRAEGPDARDLVETLAGLFAGGFGEPLAVLPEGPG